MGGMNTKRVRNAVLRSRPGGTQVEIERLRERVAALEDAVSECRRHHHRTAELTDLVQALLVPLATRDEAELQRLLREYTEQLG
jgi:cytochrome c553